MDPVSTVIGLTASLFQLIGATIAALEYLSDVKDGKDERKELGLQLRLLEELLHKLNSEEAAPSPAWGTKDGLRRNLAISQTTDHKISDSGGSAEVYDNVDVGKG